MTFRPLNASIRGIRAFSLVEVVLALGVVSFALIGILGLLFSGLITFHRSIDQTVQSQIAQQLVSQAQLTPWTALTNTGSFSTNFDVNGVGVTATDPTSVYTVNVSLTNLSPFITNGIVATAGTNFIVQIKNKTSPGTTNFFSSVMVHDN